MPSIQTMNGNTVSTNMTTRKININGEEYDIPKKVIGKVFNSVSQIDSEIYINGFHFNKKTKQWNRTLTALWHLFF